MERKSYHHGDLRNSMIEVGVSIINEEGVKGLSLRKVAKLCNVSHAAPYKHFASKEMLVEEIKNHIADDFAVHLKTTDQTGDTQEDMLLMFGINYVSYFMENPAYYKFLFNQPSFRITMDTSTISCEDFTPFSLFIETAKMIMEEMNIAEDEQVTNIILLLSIIDGLTSILVSESVDYQGDYKALVTKILTDKIKL